MVEYEYKLLKEAFVTGHSGTTPWELLLICAPGPLGMYLCENLSTTKRNSFMIQFLCIVVPILICQTHYNDSVVLLLVMCQFGLGTYFFQTRQELQSTSRDLS